MASDPMRIFPATERTAQPVDMFSAERYNILSGYPPELSSA